MTAQVLSITVGVGGKSEVEDSVSAQVTGEDCALAWLAGAPEAGCSLLEQPWVKPAVMQHARVNRKKTGSDDANFFILRFLHRIGTQCASGNLAALCGGLCHEPRHSEPEIEDCNDFRTQLYEERKHKPVVLWNSQKSRDPENPNTLLDSLGEAPYSPKYLRRRFSFGPASPTSSRHARSADPQS